MQIEFRLTPVAVLTDLTTVRRKDRWEMNPLQRCDFPKPVLAHYRNYELVKRVRFRNGRTGLANRGARSIVMDQRAATGSHYAREKNIGDSIWDRTSRWPTGPADVTSAAGLVAIIKRKWNERKENGMRILFCRTNFIVTLFPDHIEICLFVSKIHLLLVQYETSVRAFVSKISSVPQSQAIVYLLLFYYYNKKCTVLYL